MKIILQGKQLRLTEAFKRYAEEHLVRQLSRFVDDPAAELRIELGRVNASKGGSEKEVHLTLRLSGSKTLQVEETTPDAYASLDLAADRLVRVAKEELARKRRPFGRHRAHPLAGALEGEVPEDLAEGLPKTLDRPRSGAARATLRRPGGRRPGAR
ncbi:MAG TPA: HPF/RaiA family ribosome-associated protein [Myxococcales bacterium]|jgi:putative sigma-54 modulation protein|nr:HPF/RaiA family ribosome-associated protein [Myxococcales bacterium]